MDNNMSVSEYYEYKKGNDQEIADYKAEQEKAKDEQKKEKEEQTKEKIKNVVETVSSIPHFAKLSGAAAIAGLLGAGAKKAKELFI